MIEKPAGLRRDHPVAQIAVFLLVQAAMTFAAYVVAAIGSLGVSPIFSPDGGADGWVFFGASLLIAAVVFALFPVFCWQVTGNRWFLMIASLGIPLALFFLWFAATR